MTVKIQVTNQPLETTTKVAEPLLNLFHLYTYKTSGERYDPFLHQAGVFQWIDQDHSVRLIAGTAAGKTLAQGVPLFHKLQTGRIKHVLLMYPTIALMNDQRRVMDLLAEFTGLEVGHIQGGMKRSKLVEALNKPVIVATPDAIYWFFQKNVKYSGLLIYGLALIDEFVLDEAHLFSGLILQNVLRLKQRITALAKRIGRRPRWHVLTATPTAELTNLAPEAVEVTGRSKCGNVEVTFLPPIPPMEPERRLEALTQAVDDAVKFGTNKILLVLNSAAGAHRLFESMRGSQPTLSTDLQLRFGTISWGKLRRWLDKQNLDEAIGAAIAVWVESEGPFYLADLPAQERVEVSTETLMAATSGWLRRLGRSIKEAAFAAGREPGSQTLSFKIERQLTGKGKAVQSFWQMIKADLPDSNDPKIVKQALDNYLTKINRTLEMDIWSGETFIVTVPECGELKMALVQADLSPSLAEALTRQIPRLVKLDVAQTAKIRKSQAALDKRMVTLRWLKEPWLIEDTSQRQKLQERLKAAIESAEFAVETRHIATWGESGIPAIIYTGQMSRRDREGLIEAFAEMERAILVSTPAVEVGVDFKADLLVTEACDGNGFLQRFGRVGRSGDGLAQVIVLLRDGETWARLQQRSALQMDRESFSRLIIDPGAPTDPERSLFPNRTYAARSIYLDATHWLINRQLGRLGEQLNEAMFLDPQLTDLTQQMEAAETPFAYGLRGTLPQVSLLGSGGGSPFYILTKVANEDLRQSSSPFEAAEAQVSYTRFLYLKSQWRIRVDWTRTLAASRAMFFKLEGRWRIATGYGVAKSYLQSFSVVRKRRFRGDVLEMRRQLNEAKDLPGWLQDIAQLGDALMLHYTSFANLILSQGDIFLQRVERVSGTEMQVEDQLGQPIVLPNQLWLYSFENSDSFQKQLEAASLDNLDEVYYPDHEDSDLILLDELAGGCFYVYERLLDDAA